MKYIFTHKDGLGKIILLKSETDFKRSFKQGKIDKKLYTIVWNKGAMQYVVIDEIQYQIAENAILPIMMDQSFHFEKPENIIAWQFNREFYCIVNHDAEVGCVGFVFYGPSPTMFIQPDVDFLEMLNRLLEVFEEELLSEDEIKGEMLRMLLVRLIIQITRIAKKQYIDPKQLPDDKFKLLRQYNLLVEIHFKQQHQVQFYAGLLNKSPKTISNIFTLYSKKTPLQVIQERIIAEAKRLFFYTDKSVKEIADELGFDDAAHFSKFFKKCTSQNPTEFKKISQITT
jgi:AraC family transcriptional regulator, transcriptional activator of pobA